MKQKQTIQSETAPKLTVIFEPPAQNTVIRPMAEAVCIAQAGQTIPYTDTADHKEKSISLSDLHGVTLRANIKGQQQRLDGYEVALRAKEMPVRIRVDVNDVQVFISEKTTVTQAMNAFYRKIVSHRTPVSCKKSTQHERD